MAAPISKLKKSEILWLNNHYCKHSHRYLDHYSCFLKEVLNDPYYEKKRGEPIPLPQKTGYFDIEASNFQANFGIMLCYCIKEADSNKIWERCITPSEVRNPKILDKNVVKQLVKDLKHFDRICGFYSTKFDVPFVRTRAIYWGIDFPLFHEIYHTDVYYIVKRKFKLNSNRQQTAYNMLVGPSHKTHFGRDYWPRALAGDKEALKYVIEHCRIDVQELQELHEKVDPFVGKYNTSI